MNKANSRRQTHHRATGKYLRQKTRTAANKAKHIAKARALKAAADKRREAKTAAMGRS